MSSLFHNHEIITKFKNKVFNSPYKNHTDHYDRLKKIQNNRYLVLPKSLKNLHNNSPAYLPKAKLSKSIEKYVSHPISISFNGEDS